MVVMKNLTLVILGISLFIVSCKPNGCDPAQMSAQITAQRNGAIWRPAFVKGSLNAADSLTLSATSASTNSSGYTKVDSLVFTVFCSGTGSYKLHDNQVFYATFTNNGLNEYKIDTTYNNALNITGYQSLNNSSPMNPNQIKITGTFDIKFIDPNNPAGISFSNGTFNTVVNQ
jgi:hypothetical protein